MELLDRYVTEVGKHLPRKIRADIEAEIRSTLLDSLEERSQQSGRPIDEALVRTLLVEYGSPQRIAATYLPQRYLISPRMFPMFWMVLRIILAVLTTLALIGLGIRIGTGPGTLRAIAEQVGSALLEYIQGIATAFGMIVFVLAVIEYFTPAEKLDQELQSEESWTPDMLLKEPDPEQVKIWDPLLAIFFNTVALAAFNFFPQFLINGSSVQPAGERSIFLLPMLSEVFFRYLPWINLLWGLEIILNLVILRVMRRTTPIRSAQLLLKLLGIGIAVVMLTGPSLLNLTTAELSAMGISASEGTTLIQLFETMIRVALGIAVAAGSWELIVGVYRMIAKPSKSWPIVV